MLGFLWWRLGCLTSAHRKPVLVPIALKLNIASRFLLETFSLVILVLGAKSVNVAITVWSALVVTVQERVPVHPPDQPANFEPGAGVSLSPTVVPAG